MAKGNKQTPQQQQQIEGYNRAVSGYNQASTPSPLETSMTNNAMEGATQNKQDYSNIMGQYANYMQNIPKPSNFSFERVNAPRPGELNEAYGFLREAAPGYRDFANTGGYSAQDVQELRARGISPIRAAYGNTMMQMDRARALGGSGGSPNYIAAASKAQRELPGQLADATTNVNAKLAEDIRQGKLQGLAGLTGIGGTMGGLSSDEAGRQLQAGIANQGADLQTQGMRESSLQNRMQANLAGLSGQTSLYGTTPAMASTFGNQALNATGQRQQYQAAMLDAQTKFNALPPAQKTTAMWKKILGAAAAGAATYFTAGAAAPAAAGIYAGIAGAGTFANS